MMKSIVFYLLLISNISFGLDLSPRSVYLATREACNQINKSDISKGSFTLARLKMGYFKSDKFNEILSYIKYNSFNKFRSDFDFKSAHKSVQYFQMHIEVQQALNECYPTDEVMINFFINSFANADKNGKFLGLLSLEAEFLGSTKLLSLLTKWSGVAQITLDKTFNYISLALGFSLIKGDNRSSEVETTLNERLKDQSFKANLLTSKAQRMENLSNFENQIITLQSALEKCNNLCENLERLQLEIKVLTELVSKLRLNKLD